MTHVLFSVMSAILKRAHAKQRSTWLLRKTAFQRRAQSHVLIVCLKNSLLCFLRAPYLSHLISAMAFCPVIVISTCDIRRSVDCFYVIYIQELKLAQIGTSSAVRAMSVTALITKAHCVVTSFEITCLRWWQWKKGAARITDSSLASLAPRNHFLQYRGMISRLTTSKM